MKKQIQFKVDDDRSVLDATKEYFTKTGFNVVDETNGSISFSRGSTLRNMVTFNPLNWKSTVTIATQNNEVVGDFNIDTTGQLVTPKEEKLWDTFIENYRLSIVGNVDLSAEVFKELKETKKNSFIYVLWGLLGAIVFGVPLGFVAHFADIDILAPMGAAAGATIFIMTKINRDQKKNTAWS